MSISPVKSHALAMNHNWQVLDAFCTDSGMVEVRKYDPSNWDILPNGDLPSHGVAEVAIRFDQQGIGCLAIGPNLAYYTLDTNGWNQEFGLPSVQNAENIQLKTATNGPIWLSWVQVTTFDATTHIWKQTPALGWQPVGTLDGRAIDFELDDQSMPILLFKGQDYLRRWNGGNWDSLPAFPRHSGKYLNIATEADGAGLGVFALFRDSTGRLSMDRLRNGQWQQIGNPAFAMADETDLVSDFSGEPYVACVQNSVGGLPEVWKLDGNTWELVGSNAAYNNTVSKPILVFDTNTVFLSYLDVEKDFRNSVLVFGGPLASPAFVEDPQLAIYPNPVSDLLHLRLTNAPSQLRLRILDGFGKEVFLERNLSGNEWAIDLSFLNAGTYFLVVENRTGFRHIKKITKLAHKN